MLLTAKDIAKELQIPASTIYAWAKQGKIPCKRLHRLLRFEREKIDAWLASCPDGHQPQKANIVPKATRTDVDALIASVKREVYTAARGETRPKSGLIRKEEADGAV